MSRKKKQQPIAQDKNIMHASMEEALHQSMLPYAEYVIMERALPRVEDGLKPVQRRILYTLMELGLTPDKPHKKSARIVGDALGKYHPHGDTSVYDAMVRLAQDFNMREPLVDGHGNFGSVDGDSAAAMRYTEARLTSLAMELLRDLDKDTVPFRLNFDDSLKEPDMLPGRFPNLLVNGASGIAVGLATNIPPHNLGEVIDGVVAQIDKPDIPLKELMGYVKGPDFPTGGYLVGEGELYKAYETGRGKLTLRAKAEVQPGSNGKSVIVITELPYQVNKASCLEKILKLSEEKKEIFAGIADIRDESDRSGLRAVVEVRRDYDGQQILNALYKYSDLQVTFGVNMVAIAHGKPMQMGIRDINAYYIDYQKQVVRRRTRFELENAEKRGHILEGLIVAVDNIDRVIALIRRSKNPAEAKRGLMEEFSMTGVQAQAVLDLRLQRLTNLEIASLRKEYEEIQALIRKLKTILASEGKLMALIKKELLEIKKKYENPRRTHFLDEQPKVEIVVEQPAPQDTVVLLKRGGMVAQLAPKAVQRNGRDVWEEGEEPLQILHTSTDRRLQLFTNRGNLFQLDVGAIPEGKQKDKGVMLNSLLAGFELGETVLKIFDWDNFSGQLLFYTRLGMIKCSNLEEYNVKKAKVVACGLKDGDSLLNVEQLAPDTTMLFITRKGMSINVDTKMPVHGRTAMGVKAIQLEHDDQVIFAGQIETEGEVLVVSDRGYGKRSFVFDYEMQKRNGKGLKTIDFKKNGSNGCELVAAFYVKQPYPLRIQYRNLETESLSTEDFPIDKRFSKGQPVVMVLLDNVVVAVEKRVVAGSGDLTE
ncbi:MAG: DNA gyrase/topoisomerase IV subunit A [Christensenellales bacterium]